MGFSPVFCFHRQLPSVPTEDGWMSGAVTAVPAEKAPCGAAAPCPRALPARSGAAPPALPGAAPQPEPGPQASNIQKMLYSSNCK